MIPAMPSKRRAPATQMLMQSLHRTPAAPWTFRLYLGANGRNDFTKWDAALSAAGKARRNGSMRFLRAEPPQRWDRPHASALGNHVYVIRFHDQTGFKHRLFGYFDLEHHAFVICVIGYEQGDKYHPDDYEKRTERCRDEVSLGFNQRTVECPWPVA